MQKSKKRRSEFNGWLRRERQDIDNSKLTYKQGDILFTIHNKQVIPFIVDACKAAKLKRGGGISNYYCNCIPKHGTCPDGSTEKPQSKSLPVIRNGFCQQHLRSRCCSGTGRCNKTQGN